MCRTACEMCDKLVKKPIKQQINAAVHNSSAIKKRVKLLKEFKARKHCMRIFMHQNKQFQLKAEGKT